MGLFTKKVTVYDYEQYISLVGGYESAIQLVRDHGLNSPYVNASLTRDNAVNVLNLWRTKGIPQNLSLGEFMDIFYETPERFLPTP